MKEAAHFTFDWLVEDKDGYLVTAPSTSPENKFKDSDGKPAVGFCRYHNGYVDHLGPVHQSDRCIRNIEHGYSIPERVICEKAKIISHCKLAVKDNCRNGTRILKKPIRNTGMHRICSACIPGRQISAIPAHLNFSMLLKRTLEIRGDGGTGWSKAWKINWWARLLDGDHAYKLIRELFT